MAPYSMDLRERVAAAVDHQEGSQREIARLFRVSLSFIVRLLQRRREAGTLAPKPHGGGPRPALSRRDQQRLRRLVRKQNDATLKQLKQQGGFSCTLATIWNTLRRLGLTYKKKTLHAAERSRPDVQRSDADSGGRCERIEPKRLVFVDETGVSRVEVWRGGLGRCLCSLLARPFVCGCHIISTMLRFHTPLIKPGGRISRTRLSDKAC